MKTYVTKGSLINIELDLSNINLFPVECDRHCGTATCTCKTYWKN